MVQINKFKKVFFPLFLSSLIVLSLSCAPKVVPRPEVKAPTPPPSEKMEELVVPLIEEKREPERLLTFSMRDADIREALLALAKTLNYNIVLDPEVSGKATIEVRRVTIEEALDALLTPLGLQYKIENNFFRISKLRKETRVFSLNYISTKRTGSSSMTSTIAIGAGVGAGGGGISSSDLADLWGEVEAGLKNLISAEGKFTINKMAGTIMVTDFLPNLKNIAKYLEEVEGSVQRQVMIQAKLVEVTLNDEYKMGLDWSAITKLSKLKLTGTLSGGKMIAQTLSPGVGTFQIGISDRDFSALLDAMAQQGKINILSTPKISVLNNQKSAIKVTTSEVYYEIKTDIDPVSRKETTSATSKTVDIGIVLEVVPQISPEGQIIMDIHPIITEKVGDSVLETPTVKLSTPILAVREANSVVKVRDGQTMVMAGLIKEKKSEKDTKVPVMGSIPALGALFTRSEKTGQKSELVVFLTPTILTGKRIEDLSQEELRKLSVTYPEKEKK
jgi:MSHA type pilus biogenesis protein MshL